jgi:hypothetical protein
MKKNENAEAAMRPASRERAPAPRQEPTLKLMLKSLRRVEEKYDALAMGIVVPGAWCCNCHCNTSCAA